MKETFMAMGITVITLTRNRINLLKRAIASVASQKCSVPIYHLIIIDDCIETKSYLDNTFQLQPFFYWNFVKRTLGELSGPARCAKLRNIGVKLSQTKWIAFLDDDNEWIEDHLQSLYDCAQSANFRAVHSYRYLLNSNGSPYLDQKLPWCRDELEAQEIYKEFVSKGVLKPECCVMKDRIDLIDDDNAVRVVDTSEWLLSKELLVQIPFQEIYTKSDRDELISEDDKLVRDLIKICEPIGCTQKPTLKYYLGGYSNHMATNRESSFSWETVNEVNEEEVGL